MVFYPLLLTVHIPVSSAYIIKQEPCWLYANYLVQEVPEDSKERVSHTIFYLLADEYGLHGSLLGKSCRFLS